MKVPRFARTVALAFPSTILTALGFALAFLVCTAPENATAQTGSVECQPCYSWNGCECVFTGCGGNSPIIVDTTGKGFHLTSAGEGVVFDIKGNGHPLHIAWTDATSGNAFLALDRNGNGIIDSGKELFGNVTQQPPSNDPNGFLALAVFDKPEHGGNGDGIIDQRDAVFAHLLLWIDENHDGISQPEELHSLPELGVYSLALKYIDSPRTDEYGNQFRYKSAINPDPKDGESKDGRWNYDVFFTTVPLSGELLPSDVDVASLSGGAQSPPPCGIEQIPAASRIIPPDIVSVAISSSNSQFCKGTQSGWLREVAKIVTDQSGQDIVLNLEYLTEAVTIGATNQLNLLPPNTGTAFTNESGQFSDTFYACSAACPGSGQTDATQSITDLLPNGDGPYTLSPNSLVYKCTGITVNGK